MELRPLIGAIGVVLALFLLRTGLGILRQGAQTPPEPELRPPRFGRDAATPLPRAVQPQPEPSGQTPSRMLGWLFLALGAVSLVVFGIILLRG